jgi:hypothetical protein
MLLTAILTPQSGDPMIEDASLLDKEGCWAWLVGCWLRCSRVVAATTTDGPFPSPFGLFSGPGDPKNSNRGSCSASTGAPVVFGEAYASTMAS